MPSAAAAPCGRQATAGRVWREELADGGLCNPDHHVDAPAGRERHTLGSDAWRAAGRAVAALGAAITREREGAASGEGAAGTPISREAEGVARRHGVAGRHGQRRSPSPIPAPAATRPMSRLKMALRKAMRYSLSSRSRIVSKLHVENVV